MALAYALGTALVERSELVAQRKEGKFAALDVHGFARTATTLRFTTGDYSAPSGPADLAPLTDDAGNPIPFEPIGMNKPLTLAIREVYTGRYPKFPAFDRSLLIASAVKGTAVYAEAPRAVNYIEQNTSRHTRWRVFAATEKGTPYIYYTPALTQPATTMTLELNFGGFPTEITDAIGQALQTASSIPVFAPASPYLLVAGMVTKLAGNLAHVLTDSGSAEMTFSDEINFVDPGSPLPHARFVVAMDAREPDYESVMRDYMINDQGKLVLISNRIQQYDGDAPYIIFSLNGAERADLKDFVPTAATAAQLAKYYNLGEGRQTLAGVMIDMAKAFNDLSLIRRVNAIQAKLATADPATTKSLQDELNGIAASMYSDDLKKLLKLSS